MFCNFHSEGVSDKSLVFTATLVSSKIIFFIFTVENGEICHGNVSIVLQHLTKPLCLLVQTLYMILLCLVFEQIR